MEKALQSWFKKWTGSNVGPHSETIRISLPSGQAEKYRVKRIWVGVSRATAASAPGVLGASVRLVYASGEYATLYTCRGTLSNVGDSAIWQDNLNILVVGYPQLREVQVTSYDTSTGGTVNWSIYLYYEQVA